MEAGADPASIWHPHTAGRALTLQGIAEPDPAIGAIMLEPPCPTVHAEPAFYLDLSERGLPRCPMWGLPRDNHGTYLLGADDCLLVAANLMVERSGDWHCE